MIEGQRQAPVPGIDDDRGPRIVVGLRLALSPGDEHRRNGVKTRVPRGVGVGVELAAELDVERCLLAGLADGGRFERLAVIDKAAGQGPAGRRVPALDEDDAPRLPAVHDFDDDVDGGHGISEFLTAHLASRSAKAIVWVPFAPVNERSWGSSSFAAGPGKGTCTFGTCPLSKTLSERGGGITG